MALSNNKTNNCYTVIRLRVILTKTNNLKR